jgi:integration host factor subunit beta
MLMEGEAAPSNDGTGKLTKAKIIAELVQGVEFSEKEAAAILEYILDSMARAIKHGDKVEIRGFGSFGTRQRRSRVGRNPKTGARVEVPAKKIPFFKPSKELRDVVMKL